MIGEVFETAECRWCGKPTGHQFWGNGGNTWSHIGGDRWCSRPVLAEPAGEPVPNVAKGGG